MELLKENKQVPKKEDEIPHEAEAEYKFTQTIYYKYEDLPEQLQTQNNQISENKEQNSEQQNVQEEKVICLNDSIENVGEQKEIKEIIQKEKDNSSDQSMDYEDLIGDNENEKITPINSKMNIPPLQSNEQEMEKKEPQKIVQPENTQQEQPKSNDIQKMWEILQNSEGLLESSNSKPVQQSQQEPAEMKSEVIMQESMQPQIPARFAPQMQQPPVQINQPYKQLPIQQQQLFYQQQQLQQAYVQEPFQQPQQVAAGQVFTNFIMIFTSCNNSDKVWYYKDPQDQIQGPFSTTDMQVWCNDQYFSGNLPIAWAQNLSFITLNQFKEKSTNLIKVSLQANQQIFALLSVQVQQQLAKQYQLTQQQQQQEQMPALKGISPQIQKPFYQSPSPSLPSIQHQQTLQQLEMQKQNAQQEILELSQKLKNLQEVIMQMQYQQIEIPKEYLITYQLCQNKMQQYQEFSRTVQYQINQMHQQIQAALQQQSFTPPLSYPAQQYQQIKQFQQSPAPATPSPQLIYQFYQQQQQTKSPNANQMMNSNYQNYQQYSQYEQQQQLSQQQQQQQQQSLQFQNLAMFDYQQNLITLQLHFLRQQQSDKQQQQQQQQFASPIAFQNFTQLQKETQMTQSNEKRQQQHIEQNWQNVNEQEEEEYEYDQ